tara:strand:- start:355 stop:1812 length:1458 start_codon:yes stop_codon:yes gene_type:complete
MSVVLRKSALASFLEELPTIIARNQEQKAQQAYQTQVLLLRDTLDEKRALKQEYRENLSKMVEMGATADMLAGVTSEYATSPINSKDLIKAPLDLLTKKERELQQKNAELDLKINQGTVNIATWERGRNWRIQRGEFFEGDMTALSEEEAALMSNPWFALGVQSSGTFAEYAKTAKGMEEIAGKDIEIEERKTKAREDVKRQYTREDFIDDAVAEGVVSVGALSDDMGIDTKYKRLKYTKNLTELGKTISSEELNDIATRGALESGAGYEDVVSGQFDYSDEFAFEEGLKLHFRDKLANEGKMGLEGYDDASIDRAINAFKKGLSENQDYTALSDAWKVAIYESKISQEIYADVRVQETLGDKAKLASQIKNLIIDKDGLKPSYAWKNLTKKQKKLFGKDEDKFNSAVSLLAGVDDTNVLTYLYANDDAKVRELLEIATGDTATNLLAKVSYAEKLIEAKLPKPEIKIKKDDDEKFLQELLDMYQ